jgi:Carboxypeptidase regulatory-like domain
MKLVSVVTLALLLQNTPNLLQVPKRPGILEGVVTRSDTDRPVAGARVTLTRVADPQGNAPADPGAPGRGGPQQPQGPPTALTDDKGRFTFQVEEGLYLVEVHGNGYVPQMYGGRFAEDQGTPVSVTAGQPSRDVNITLTPAATISGRIRDESDRPLVNVPVQLLHYSYDYKGDRAYQPGSAVQTNDRGEYRMYWVTPGRYYVLAGRPTTGSNPMLEIMTLAIGGTGAAGNRVPGVKGYAFYPGVVDISNARAVDLQPGTDLQAIDVTLAEKPRTYSIRGKLMDSRTGRAPPQANVFVSPQTPGLQESGIASRLVMQTRNYDSATGRIEIRDLAPGVYSVLAIVPDLLAASRRGPPNQSSGVLTVNVSDADVEDIVLPVSPAGSIEGRLRVEGRLPASMRIEELRIALLPTGANSAAQQTMQTQLAASSGFYDSEAAQTRADGTFRMSNIPLGDYRLEVILGPARRIGNEGFIKEARFEGADVLNSPLHLSGSGALDIVIAMGGGKLEGSVTDVRSHPASGAQVVLVPDRSRYRPDLYQTTMTDKNGRFSLSAITPGDYKVFAWELIEEFAWFDPDVLARFESRSRTVHVTETSSETVDVKVIQADGAR